MKCELRREGGWRAVSSQEACGLAPGRVAGSSVGVGPEGPSLGCLREWE